METFQSIGQWTIATFGKGNPLAIYAKLGEEFGELARPIQKKHYDKAILEMADMVIVLSHMASSIGLDLQRAVEEKMAVNKVRTWKITAEGTGSHVEVGASPPPAPHSLTAESGTLCIQDKVSVSGQSARTGCLQASSMPNA